MNSDRARLALAAIIFYLATFSTAQSPVSGVASNIVKTESGPVSGAAKNGVVSWKGIPYAAPPVGKLRWRVPQPVKPWTAVKPTIAFGPQCMQSDEVPKSEDCLTINVWRPANPSGPLPVMVWIYGGGLIHGQTSLYPADALAAQGVMVVSMNYRMGRLGFFAHPALAKESPDDVQGNYGYMDQLAALKWVQRNIAAFGGDPAKVTIFGESAGGGSVMVHLTSPMSRGLFQRAIMQSPGIPTSRAKVTPTTELADAQKMAVEYARSLGITGEGPAALNALRALPASKLLEGASTKDVIGSITSEKSVIGVAGAIHDGKLIIEVPEIALAKGHQAKVPVIIGSNTLDLWTGNANSKDELFAVFGPHAAEARKIYDPRGDQSLDQLKQQVFADKTMAEPARHLANEMTRAGQPVWLYLFGYVPESQRATVKGTAHGMEIPYTFDIPAAIVRDKVTSADKTMGAIASGYWVQFGKIGNPNGGGRPTWLPYNPTVDTLLQFSNSGVIAGTDPLKSRLDLWQAVWGK